MKFHSSEWRLRLKFHQALEVESSSKDEISIATEKMRSEHSSHTTEERDSLLSEIKGCDYASTCPANRG